ncbi:MAG: asparagine synthase (glutamine-hydrolyzing) [Bacteroidetes bacterium]|nr:asparagine synthase (glutamine-hydrolyzing) [Bacteroidota bacterium]
MCGIAGIVHLNSEQVRPDKLRSFTDSIFHRGPDGSGYELVENGLVGFGHRRLSILDLTEAGKQPMYSSDKKLLITYNGEVYNFLEIKKELEGLGNNFNTKTDTEVILKAYQQWGMDCLNRFNGMFAIAIWDFQKKSLKLVRDRFGVKPLYFLFVPDSIFAFASETIAFKHLANFKREINNDVFQLALQQPELIEGSDKTIYKKIYQLRPGHFLELNNFSTPQVKRWWNTKDHFVEIPTKYEHQVEKFTELFEDACKIRMRSDVTLASALSGGLDSSSVYSTLHEISKSGSVLERVPSNWQQAFVATFPGTSIDERSYAEKVVNAINGKAIYITPDYSNLVNEIIKTTRLFDGVVSTPIISISDIYKSMRNNGVTVSMDGHGVDEMMYGYNSYVYQAFYDAIEESNFKRAEEYALILCGLSPNYNINDLRNVINSFNKSKFRKGISLLRNKLFRNYIKQNNEKSVSWYQKLNSELIHEINIQQDAPEKWSKSEKMVYNDFHNFSLPINLRDFDRASMQNGIEIRMPFMDYRLVTYVFSLPISSKIGNGFTKLILRDSMKGILPEEIRTRTYKVGIGAPMQEWFEGVLKEFVFDTINSVSFKQSPFWNADVISEEISMSYKMNKLNKSFCNKTWNILNAQIILDAN